MISVLLADDHAVLRDGLKSLLESDPGVRVVASVCDGWNALVMTKQLQPNIAILDITMPGLNGLEATAQIVREAPQTQVIILSMHAAAEHVARALKAGARGYLVKDAAGAEVLSAVRAVAAGRRYLSRGVSELIADFLSQESAGNASDPLELLSERERQILQLVVEGNSSAQIARQLFLSPKTIDSYRSRLMQKLEVQSLAELIRFAIRHRLLAP